MSVPYQYIVVHTSCRTHPGVLACQTAHAARQSMTGPGETPAVSLADVHVVALEAESSSELEQLYRELVSANISATIIREPDPPYNGAATAVGIAPTADRMRVRRHVDRFRILR